MAGPISDDDLGFGGASLGSEPSYLAALGRISGKALSDNLVRNGVDLTFRNGALDLDLLYLDVTNKRIGVNYESPSLAFQVTGDGKVTEDVIVTGTSAKLNNIIFKTNGTITTQVGPINIVPTGLDSIINYNRILTDDLELRTNYIAATKTNEPIELWAHGTGIVDIQSSGKITGNLQVTGNIISGGNIQLDGQFTVGDTSIDTVTFNTDFTQSIIPGDNNTYNFGSTVKNWANIYLSGSFPGVQTVDTNNVQVGGQTLISGNTISSVLSNDDIIFNTSGTGIIDLEDFRINGSTITNTIPNTITAVNSTGIGYWKVDGTNAIQIPSGTDGQRGYTEIGETRWNSDRGYLECFDGNVYLVATGGGAVVTPFIMEELGDLYALMLG